MQLCHICVCREIHSEELYLYSCPHSPNYTILMRQCMNMESMTLCLECPLIIKVINC
uniref:Uncharacterized protein n=1 Tax=Salmo trutta TaxID=8032 RepID=A0A674AYQ4_SALTR